MYQINDAVQCNNKIGRIFSFGDRGNIHVLVRINNFTWKLETWFGLSCRYYEGFLWTFYDVFKSKPIHKKIDEIVKYQYVIKRHNSESNRGYRSQNPVS